MGLDEYLLATLPGPVAVRTDDLPAHAGRELSSRMGSEKDRQLPAAAREYPCALKGREGGLRRKWP